MAEFVVVPREEVPTRRESSGRKRGALGLALERGETVFLPGVKSSPSTYLYRLGYKLHSRRGNREGVAGLYLWAEKNGTDKA